jgi:hypothetical protein
MAEIRTPAAAAIWEEAPFELVYRLGEITLFTRSFRALNLCSHFLDLTNDPMQPAPPIRRLGHECDVIVTRSHPVPERLPVLTVIDGALRYVPDQFIRFHTSLAGTFEDYLAKFSGKTRSTLRKKVKRFLDSGEGSRMRSFAKPDEIAEFHRLARGISARTYQERLLDAGIPEDASFVKDLEALASRNAVRAYILLLRGEPVAYLCCPAVRDILFYGYLGYDPTHAALSPGTVLQYLAFEELFRDGAFRAFDFTEGHGEHKKLFATHGILCANICYFAPTYASWFWVGLHRGLDRISSSLGQILDRVGLKKTIKRLIRRT